MGNTAVYDLQTFLISIGIGISLCLIYDVFRIARLANRPAFLFSLIQDMTYAFLAALVTFILLLVRCIGEIRWFVIAGEGIGFFACRLSVSRLIMAVSKKIIQAVTSVLRFLKKWLILPFVILFQWFARKCRMLMDILYKKVEKMLKKALQPFLVMMYNELHKAFHRPKKSSTSDTAEVSDNPLMY